MKRRERTKRRVLMRESVMVFTGIFCEIEDRIVSSCEEEEAEEEEADLRCLFL